MTSRGRHKLFVFGLVLFLLGIGGVFFATHSSTDQPVATGPSPEELLGREPGRGQVAGDSIYAPTVPAVIAAVAAEQAAVTAPAEPTVQLVAALRPTPAPSSPVLTPPYTPPAESTPQTPPPSMPEPPVVVLPPVVPAGPTPYVPGNGGSAPEGFGITRSQETVTLAPGETSTTITYATTDGSSVIWTPTSPNIVWSDSTFVGSLSDYWMVLGFSDDSYVGPSVTFQLKTGIMALANPGIEVGMRAEDGSRNIQATPTTKLIIQLPTVVVPPLGSTLFSLL